MGLIYSIVNQKGGVGKTTTSVNLGAFLADEGKRVLLVDLDPQANASSGVGLQIEKIKVDIYDSLLGGKSVREIIHPTSVKNMHIVPAGPDLAGATVELVDSDNREFKLKEMLAPVKDLYDFILIDCPPSLGILTVNALAASQRVIVPVQCEYYAMEGLSRLMQTLEIVKQELNPTLMIEGILLTMYDPRTSLNREVVKETQKHFKKQVYKAIIPRNVAISEAPSHGQPITIYAKKSAGAKAYREFAQEVIKGAPQ